MADLDGLLAQEIDRILPRTTGRGADWDAVVGRAVRRRRRARARALLAVAIATVAVAAATPLGAALDGALGDFSAWLSGNPGSPATPSEQRAFYIADHPRVGERVRGVDAVAGDATTVALPFASAPFGTTDLAAPPVGRLHGPSRVDRVVRDGSIGWIDRREPRGEAFPPALLDRLVR